MWSHIYLTQLFWYHISLFNGERGLENRVSSSLWVHLAKWWVEGFNWQTELSARVSQSFRLFCDYQDIQTYKILEIYILIMSDLLKIKEYWNSALALMFIYNANQNRLILTYRYLYFLLRRNFVWVIILSKQDSRVNNDFTFNETLCRFVNQPWSSIGNSWFWR